MSNARIAGLAAGLLTATLAVAPFIYQGSGSHPNNLKAVGEIQGLGASWYEALAFTVRYPQQLRIGESQIVVVEIQQEAASEAPGKINHASVKDKATIRLSGAGFDISPSEAIGKRVAPYEGAAMWAWTVSPRPDHFGHQELVLTIDGRLRQLCRTQNERTAFQSRLRSDLEWGSPTVDARQRTGIATD